MVFKPEIHNVPRHRIRRQVSLRWVVALVCIAAFGCGGHEQQPKSGQRPKGEGQSSRDREPGGGIDHILFLTSTFPEPEKPWQGETRVFLDDKTVAIYKHNNLERDVSFTRVIEAGCQLRLVYSDAYADGAGWRGELLDALYRQKVALSFCESGVCRDVKFLSWKYVDSKRRMDIPRKEVDFSRQDEIEYDYDYRPVGNGDKALAFFRNLRVKKGEEVVYIWPLPVDVQEAPQAMNWISYDPVYILLLEKSDNCRNFVLDYSERTGYRGKYEPPAAANVPVPTPYPGSYPTGFAPTDVSRFRPGRDNPLLPSRSLPTRGQTEAGS